MLELKDVHTHYGLSHVLQGVSLRVDAGEVVGLLGRNGVGKTTVMKTIAGWVAPSQGSVFVGADGVELAAERRVHQPQQKGQQRRHTQQHQQEEAGRVRRVQPPRTWRRAPASHTARSRAADSCPGAHRHRARP